MVNILSISSFYFMIDTALALICQKCNSVSLKSCDVRIHNITCMYPLDVCITMTTSYTLRKQNGIRETISEVIKGCALSKYGCENMCSVQPGHNCQIGCCTGNYCNRTPDPRILSSNDNSIHLSPERGIFCHLQMWFMCMFVIYLQT